VGAGERTQVKCGSTGLMGNKTYAASSDTERLTSLSLSLSLSLSQEESIWDVVTLELSAHWSAVFLLTSAHWNTEPLFFLLILSHSLCSHPGEGILAKL